METMSLSNAGVHRYIKQKKVLLKTDQQLKTCREKISQCLIGLLVEKKLVHDMILTNQVHLHHHSDPDVVYKS